MSTIRAVVVDPAAPDRLAFADVAAPNPAPNEALVRLATHVTHIDDLKTEMVTLIQTSTWVSPVSFVKMLRHQQLQSHPLLHLSTPRHPSTS